MPLSLMILTGYDLCEDLWGQRHAEGEALVLKEPPLPREGEVTPKFFVNRDVKVGIL